MLITWYETVELLALKAIETNIISKQNYIFITWSPDSSIFEIYKTKINKVKCYMRMYSEEKDKSIEKNVQPFSLVEY